MRVVIVLTIVVGTAAMLGLGKAAADPLRSTSTTVSCPGALPFGVPAVTCTATVADTASGTATTPTGHVEFSETIRGFAERATCALSAGSCQVSYPADVIGMQTITAAYGGDSGHAGSSGAQEVYIFVGPRPPCCYLPRVKGETLGRAKRDLHRFHWRIGRIHRAFSKRVAMGRVISETPRPGIVFPRYTKIAGQFTALSPITVALVVSKGKRHARP